MILKNAIIIDENFKRQRLDIRVCNDKIVEIIKKQQRGELKLEAANIELFRDIK